MNKISEHQIQNSIINYLRYKQYIVERMNSGAMRQRDSRGKQYIIRMHSVGTPDIMAFKRVLIETPDHESYYKTILLFIEVKVPGNSPTRMQSIKMQELTEHGARCYVIHSLEELQALGI